MSQDPRSFEPESATLRPSSAPLLPAVSAVPGAQAVVRPSWRFLLAHPAHCIALGFGAGLSPLAPGTVGTLWAWLVFVVLQQYLSPPLLAWVVAASLPLGWWASTVTAKHLHTLDPASIVWDEVAAFWMVLMLIAPAGFFAQLAAFALFRFFDAVKPGPVAWADHLFHVQGYKGGLGIMLDDVVAAGCTLLVMAWWRF